MNTQEICAAGVVLACAAATAYILSRPRGPASVSRSEEGAHTVIRVRANRDLSRVEVGGGAEGAARLSRAGMRKGESVEFRIPAAQGRVRVLVDDGSSQRTFDE